MVEGCYNSIGAISKNWKIALQKIFFLGEGHDVSISCCIELIVHGLAKYL